MEVPVRGYFEDEVYDYPDEIFDDGVKTEEEKKPVIDYKAARAALYVKRKKSRKRKVEKVKKSNIAQKKKKLAREEKLGASILSTRPIVLYFAKKTKQELAQAK